jgi:hypothetical protein
MLRSVGVGEVEVVLDASLGFMKLADRKISLQFWTLLARLYLLRLGL